MKPHFETQFNGFHKIIRVCGFKGGVFLSKYITCVTQRPEEVGGSPGTGVAGIVSCLVWMLGTELGFSGRA